ncbi:MAG TPA: hypothetical protein VFE19_13435 [Jatrophihabitantaceae bacterium]|jgi:ribose transport system permease protein|nr:hypothetical protein [Jatrophihabitantaceae bacterium]
MNQGNLLSTVQGTTDVGLMACGMVFPLATRDVDLCVGGNFALGIVVGADLIHHGWNPWLATVATVVLCGCWAR